MTKAYTKDKQQQYTSTMNSTANSCTLNIIQRHSLKMGTQILGAKLPWWLHFVWWCRMFVNSPYGTCLSPFLYLEFWRHL